MTSDTTRRALIGALPALAVAPAAAATAGEPDPVFALLARVREARQDYEEARALAHSIWYAERAQVEQELLGDSPPSPLGATTFSGTLLNEKYLTWRDALWTLAMQPPTTVAGAIASLECGGCQVYGDLICANAAESLRRLTGGV